MIARRFWLGLACASLVLCGAAVAQEKPDKKPAGDKKPADAKPQAGEMGMEEMMAAWEKMSALNENHKMLLKSAGEWTTENKMWEDPAGEPMVTAGTCSIKPIWEGRYMQGLLKGEMMGKPFEGISFDGYDNQKQKFVSMWIDNMSTGLFTMEGTYDEATKAITYHAEMPDPMAAPGTMVKIRAVAKKISDDKHVFEWFETHTGEKEKKTMEITYTRKG